MNRLWIPLVALAATSFASTPTFTKDVAPILFEHCASCHRAGEIGPMPLLTYQDARPWAKAIREWWLKGRCRRGMPRRIAACLQMTVA